MEFEFSVQIIDKFIGGGLVFIYLAAFLISNDFFGFVSLFFANNHVYLRRVLMPTVQANANV